MSSNGHVNQLAKDMDMLEVPPPKTHQVEQLLSLCFHYMDQDLRGKLMRELPQAYNAYVGWQVVTVVHTRDHGREA